MKDEPGGSHARCSVFIVLETARQALEYAKESFESIGAYSDDRIASKVSQDAHFVIEKALADIGPSSTPAGELYSRGCAVHAEEEVRVLLRAVAHAMARKLWRRRRKRTMARLSEEQQRKLDVMLHENSLQSSEDEVKSWLDALLGEGLSFDQALVQAELMFSEG